MRVFGTERELRAAQEFPAKEFLVSVVDRARAGYGSEGIDILADCGKFYLIEDSDEVSALRLFDDADCVDLTDPERMVYDFVMVSENKRYFALFWMISNSGGPVFVIPHTTEMVAAFRRVMPE